MKKYIITAVVFIVLCAVIGVQCSRIKSVSSDRDRLSDNQSTLFSAVDTFKVADSLNAIKVKDLTLTIDEYKKYRAGDLQTIKSLNADISRLQNVSTTQTETIYKLKGTVHDSIIIRDNFIRDTLRCVTYTNPWLDFVGCFDKKSSFDGRIESRDSLIYEEHIVPKRFLGFLWKYGCKERRQNIVSKNPYTKIVSAEFITIKKMTLKM